jgi:hypothetical protein
MSDPRWNLREILSRVMAGGAFGVFALMLLSIALAITAIFLGAAHKKGTWATDVAIWKAIYGLPGSFVLGAIAGIHWQRRTAVHFTLLELIIYCLVVIFACFVNTPAISMIRESKFTPLWQLVPNIMVEFFGILAIVGVVWLVGYHLIKWTIKRFRHDNSA